MYSLKKIYTYFHYLREYLKYRDYVSIIAAVKYLLFRTSHSKDRIIQTSVGLFYCRKNTNDFQFANLHYEWGVKKYLLNHVEEYDLFIDGGSCVGEYCILLTKHKIRCIAFEPIQSNFEILTKNLELNQLSEAVMAFPYGLGEANEQVRFEYNPVNTGASHIAQQTSPNNCLSDIRTFDSLISELKISPKDRILFKLDVEGMEVEALRGAKLFVRQFDSITFILEDKHSGKGRIVNVLNELANFEIGMVDEYNIFAKKINNKFPKNKQPW